MRSSHACCAGRGFHIQEGVCARCCSTRVVCGSRLLALLDPSGAVFSPACCVSCPCRPSYFVTLLGDCFPAHGLWVVCFCCPPVVGSIWRVFPRRLVHGAWEEGGPPLVVRCHSPRGHCGRTWGTRGYGMCPPERVCGPTLSLVAEYLSGPPVMNRGVFLLLRGVPPPRVRLPSGALLLRAAWD